MTSLYQIIIYVISLLALLHTVVSLPLLANQFTSESDLYDYGPELDKRDLEEVMIPEIPERLSVLLQLPRTYRKQFIENYYDQQIPSEFDTISSKTINLPVNSESQKEVTGPIVVGPQTKSIQTNSAKKQ